MRFIFYFASMKKILSIAFLLSLTFMVVGCTKVSTDETVWSGQNVAIVSGHPEWSPIMYQSGDSIVGIGVEVNKAVFKYLGFDVDAKYVGSRDVVQEKAKNWEIDVIVALYKTTEREQYLDYSISYTQDPIVLFLNTWNEFVYDKKENLIGKKWVATIWDSYGQELDDFIVISKLDMTRVATPEEAFALVKDGKADYFIYSLYAGRKVINQDTLTGLVESNVVSSQPFYIGISKKSPYAKYMKEINASLEKLIAEKKIPIN